MRIYLPIFFLTAVAPLLQAQATAPSLGGCSLLPADNVWHARVDNLPVLSQSSTYVATLGASSPAHPDFGEDPDNGIPYNLVPGNSTAAANVSVLWPFTSDPGPYPIPNTAVAETPSNPGPSGGDHHLIVVDTDNCILYEAFDAILNSAATDAWSVDSISKFTLSSDALKPPNWSSSNSAGTTYLPGLIRYDEVAAGHIDHAIAMTATGLASTYIWPASRASTSLVGSQYPPMGTRFRLKASVDISTYSPTNKVILEALKTYGAIVMDNGASWFLVGVPDSRWNDGDLHSITQLNGSDFEAVDESSLEVSASSGQVKAGSIPAGWVNVVNTSNGQCLQVTTGMHSGLAKAASVGGLRLAACSGSTAQKFQFVPEAGGWSPSNSVEWVSSNGNGYMINSASNGLQVSVPNGTNKVGTQMVTAAFADQTGWIWQPVSTGNGLFYIQSLANGLVLEDASASAVDQYTYNGSQKELWTIVAAQ